jgi:hypothetical protein
MGGISGLLAGWIHPKLAHAHDFKLERDGRPMCFCGTDSIEAASEVDCMVFDLGTFVIPIGELRG